MTRVSKAALDIFSKALIYLAFIILWELVFKSGFWPDYLFPSPFGVVKNLYSGFKDTSFFIAISISLKRVLVGYSISLGLGLVIGLTIVRIRYLDQTISPLLLGMQTLPSICWLPMAILWFGIGEDAIIFVIAIGSVFSISMAIVSGIKNIPPIYLRVAKTMGARGLKAYTNVILPAALPSFVSGMKQGWSFAWRALMAGELLSPKDGLGYVLTVGRDLHDMNQVLAIMIIIVSIGLIIDKLIFGQVEKSISTRWGLNQA